MTTIGADSASSGNAANKPMVVIPCFNEELRLDQEQLTRLAASEPLRLLFVNDGSTDSTATVLAAMAGRNEDIELLSLRTNVGKAEAVRRGMLHAIRTGAPIVGYYDADLATPPNELLRLLAAFEHRGDVSVVLGARVARLGTAIERTTARHYLGRLFATVSSFAIGVRVYDTQCGAKLFRVTPALRAALRRPFVSSWSFDVTLLDRLLTGVPGIEGLTADDFLEVPLEAWRDVAGSKLRPAAMAGAFGDVVRIGMRRRWRAHERGAGQLIAFPDPMGATSPAALPTGRT